jgi:hypothetical protein
LQQTISQAARLYGKARSTIHRAIGAGRLSSSVRGDGVRVIDLSELLRLWGEPANQPASTQQDATESMQQQAQQAILNELRALRELYLAGLEENKALRREVCDLKEAMLRLPAPQPRADIPLEQLEKRQEEKVSASADDPYGFRSLVRAIRDAESVSNKTS